MVVRNVFNDPTPHRYSPKQGNQGPYDPSLPDHKIYHMQKNQLEYVMLLVTIVVLVQILYYNLVHVARHIFLHLILFQF
jgi:hypothetical protein